MIFGNVQRYYTRMFAECKETTTDLCGVLAHKNKISAKTFTVEPPVMDSPRSGQPCHSRLFPVLWIELMYLVLVYLICNL